MDWNLVISRNHALLLRIVAELFAMARIVEGGTSFALPRHLYNAIMLILRPAESAIRRLVIIAARGLVLKTRASRSTAAGLASFSGAALTRTPVFRLIDPLKQFGPGVCDQEIDPVSFFHPADDLDPELAWQRAQFADAPVDATLLFNRLRAMRLALNDLPRQARRLARWQARKNLALAGKTRPMRLSPFRPGLPPGYHKQHRHKVDHVLRDVHYFAREAWNNPDSS